MIPKLNNNLFQELWLHNLAIAYFVCDEKSYWVLDHSYNYRLDIESEARASLEKGRITLEIFNRGMKNARGGIPQLKKENFRDYLDLETTTTLLKSELKEIMFHGYCTKEIDNIYTSIQNYLFYGDKISDQLLYDINQIRSRLPRYYINFDRKIFLHTDYDLSPEGTVTYDNWLATDGDFSYYIPDNDIYWILENKNFWKTMFI